MLRFRWFRSFFPFFCGGVLCSLPTNGQAAIYYVDGRDGNDHQDGLAPAASDNQQGPKRTWTWFSGVDGGGLKSGDQVLFRRGTTIRRDHAKINMRCSNMNGVTFGAYGSKSLPDPVIDSCGELALHIGYNGPTHGLTFENLKFVTSKPRPKGEMITAYADPKSGPGHAEGVTFRHIEVDATNQTGVEVSDETITFSANNATIEDCYLYGPGRNGIYIAGENNVIQRNRVFGFRVGIKLNSDTWMRPRRNVVRRNRILANLVGLELAEADHCDVYANLVSDGGDLCFPFFVGIQLEDDEFDDGEPGAEFINVFNNTVLFNAKSGSFYGIRSTKGDEGVGRGNVVQNNIVSIFNTAPEQYFVLQRHRARLPKTDNNLYFSEGLAHWRRNDTTYDTQADWTSTADAPDAHSIVSDPRLAEDPSSVDLRIANFGLRKTSPAIDAGRRVQMHTKLPYEDFLGNPYLGPPDIGAFEYQGTGQDVTRAGPIPTDQVDRDEHIPARNLVARKQNGKSYSVGSLPAQPSLQKAVWNNVEDHN